MGHCKVAVIALGFIAFDIVTGLIQAIKNGTYKSTKMREGLFHKCGEILSMIFASGCEFAFPYIGIDVSLPITKSVYIYIIIMEVGSIIENLANISPGLKDFLLRTFKPYRDTYGDKEKGDNEQG